MLSVKLEHQPTLAPPANLTSRKLCCQVFNLFNSPTFVFNQSHSTGPTLGKKREANARIKILPRFDNFTRQHFAKVSSGRCQLCFMLVCFSSTFCFPNISSSFIGVCLQFYGLGSLRSRLAPRCELRGRSWQAGISLFIARPSEQVATRTMGTS